ncbi:MAG: hypothetical protein ACXAEL_14925 [Candidatus Hodarchaeales archaeon]
MTELALIMGLSVNIILLVVCFPTLGLLAIRLYQTRVAQIYPMLAITLATIIMAIAEILILSSSDESQVRDILGPIVVLTWMICFVGFAFFLAGLTRNSIFCRETAIALLLAGFVGGLALAGTGEQIEVVQQDDVLDFRTGQFMSLIMGPLMIFVSTWGFFVLNKTRQFAVSLKQERQQRIFVWGMSIAFFGPLIANSIGGFAAGLFPDLEEAAFLFLITVPNLLIGLGLLAVIVAYGSNKEIFYLQPQQLYSLMVIERTGLPVFSFRFPYEQERLDGDVDTILTAGALKAISSFLKEAVGGQEEIREIVTADRIVIAKTGATKQFIAVLIADRASSFVHDALTKFTATFATEYGPCIEKFTGNLADFHDADRVVLSTFGFG